MSAKEILTYVLLYIFGYISLASCVAMGVKIGLSSFLEEKQLKLENNKN